jgi:hypothetical protein
MTSLLPFATTLKYSELAENVSLLPHFSVIPVISTILVYFADSERMNARNSAGRSERPPGFPELPGLWALSTRRWRLPPTCPERVAEFPPVQAIRTSSRNRNPRAPWSRRPRECPGKRGSAAFAANHLFQEKSFFNSSVKASFPARLADAVVSK